MIDTHAHLDFDAYDEDRDQVIKRFFGSGGKAIINVGCNLEHIEKSLQLSKIHKNVFFTAGIHPEEEGADPGSVNRIIDKFLAEETVVAIGEIGLDYFHNNKNKLWQKELFEEQLQVAEKSELPVVIHCRQAYDDLLQIIKDEKYRKLKMVIHCYEANIGNTEKFLAYPNIWFSFTGNITYSKDAEAEIFQVIRMIPLSRIMVETDCPFLTPDPMRGKRNEPSYVRFIIEKIAEVKKMNVGEVESQTDQNAIDFFNLPINAKE